MEGRGGGGRTDIRVLGERYFKGNEKKTSLDMGREGDDMWEKDCSGKEEKE